MSSENIRQKIKEMANSQADPTGWFETVYVESGGDTSLIPWAKLTVHPQLEEWLKQRPVKNDQQRALVLGCGLGDDGEALASSGFNVTCLLVTKNLLKPTQKPKTCYNSNNHNNQS